jgi:hypothetical protein
MRRLQSPAVPDLFDQAAMKTVLHQQFTAQIRDCAPVVGSYHYEADY